MARPPVQRPPSLPRLSCYNRAMDGNIESTGSGTSGSLAGQVAIVTGASRGIGRAVARLFAQEGAAVVLASRNGSVLQANAREITATGGRALVIETDVADEGSVASLFSRTRTSLGP